MSGPDVSAPPASPWTSVHVESWLVDTGSCLTTADGKEVKYLVLRHAPNEEILSAWAKHLRNHYCPDDELDGLRQGTGRSRADYLSQMVFPDGVLAPGPSVRAGDFAEILIADYLEYLLGYWVPRYRYDCKTSRNESTRGMDILGFRLVGKGESPHDVLATFEAKAALSGRPPGNRLQDAVAGLANVVRQRAEALNALKRRLRHAGDWDAARKVERFQNPVDKPYHEVLGAAAMFSTHCYDPAVVASTDTTAHASTPELVLVVVTGDDLMRLAHDLYERAAREA